MAVAVLALRVISLAVHMEMDMVGNLILVKAAKVALAVAVLVILLLALLL